MATTREQRIIDRFISQFTDEIAVAWREVINGITSRVNMRNLIAAIERNDIEAVLRVIAIDRPAIRPVDAVIERAVEVGGNAITATFPQAVTATYRFDIRNSRAEQWLRNESSTLVTRITEGVREAVRIALDRRMVTGSNPRTTALDLAGRIDPATGRRTGGLVGLTGPQAGWVARASEELASGDPEQLARYLTRERRDARFDPAVRRAIAAGTGLDPATQARMIGRYSDSLLQLRGETIARTESIAALNRAQYESYAQAVDNGAASKAATNKEWDSAGNDGRTRDSHLKLDGIKVKFNEPFTSPATGRKMMHPCDISMGAAAEDVINCRCRVKYNTDWLALGDDDPAPEPVPEAPEVRNARIKAEQDAEVLQAGRANDNEHLTAFDNVTGYRYPTVTSGNHGTVTIPPELMTAINNPVNRIDVTHNHPNDWSFSPADKAQVFMRPGMRELTAMGHGGSVYRMQATDTARALGGYPEALIQRIESVVKRAIQDWFRADRRRNVGVSNDDANAVMAHLESEILARAGFVKYSATFAGDTASAMNRLAPLIANVLSRINLK